MPFNTASTRELRVDDLTLLAEALRATNQPLSICHALEILSAETIGHRLFTIMHFDSSRSEVLRIHSNLPSTYPTGARKQKKETAWANRVLGEMKVFRGNWPADIRSAFDDHETILGLGLGSVLNIPVVFDGRCVGTMNLLHQAGWYRPEHEGMGLSLGAFLIPVLLNGNS
jgi:GAF domain-containing protein